MQPRDLTWNKRAAIFCLVGTNTVSSVNDFLHIWIHRPSYFYIVDYGIIHTPTLALLWLLVCVWIVAICHGFKVGSGVSETVQKFVASWADTFHRPGWLHENPRSLVTCLCSFKCYIYPRLLHCLKSLTLSTSVIPGSFRRVISCMFCYDEAAREAIQRELKIPFRIHAIMFLSTCFNMR
jgi:hypothetical protein